MVTHRMISVYRQRESVSVREGMPPPSYSSRLSFSQTAQPRGAERLARAFVPARSAPHPAPARGGPTSCFSI